MLFQKIEELEGENARLKERLCKVDKDVSKVSVCIPFFLSVHIIYSRLKEKNYIKCTFYLYIIHALNTF